MAFTESQPETYEKYTRFYMPTEDGRSVLSMAASQRSGNFFVSSYGIMLTFAFGYLWDVVLCLVLAFLPSMDSPNRHVLMIGFWNSGDPQTAMEFMFSYTKAALRMKTRDGKWDWHTFRLSCLLFFVTISGFLGSIAAGIVLSADLDIGNAAPANPSAVYFARPPPNMTNSERVRAQALRAPAAIRAIGNVAVSGTELQNQVPINVGKLGEDTKISYSYSVYGWELGLQKYPEFQQTVEGECITIDSWVNSNGEVDEYIPWGNQSEIVIVSKTTEKDDPPRAEIRIHPDSISDAANGRKILFAIIPHTVGRRSFTGSTDPWYKTVPTNTTSADSSDKVDSGRPALSCWQTTNYTYKGSTVDSVFNLGSLKGFDIPRAWDNHLRVEFGLPKIIDLGTSLGRGILLSSATYLDVINGYFDAGSSSIQSDIERLVLGAFVASRDIFRDSTMVEKIATNEGNLPNAAIGNNGRPEPGVGEFTLISKDIMTLRFDILVAVPVFTAASILLSLIIPCLLMKKTASNEGFRARFASRCYAFQATQLYRYMDEHVPATTDGESPAGTTKRWEGRLEPIPYIGKSKSGGPAPPTYPRALKPRATPITEVDPNAGTGEGSMRAELVLTRTKPDPITEDIPWKHLNHLHWPSLKGKSPGHHSKGEDKVAVNLEETRPSQ